MTEHYYVLERENNDQQPLFAWDQPSEQYGLGAPVNSLEPINFKLREPIPKNPDWADFHKSPYPVVSPRLARTLKSLDMYGVDFVPANVRNPDNDQAAIQSYVLLHVWQRIQCIDHQASTIRASKSGKLIHSIDKFVIDTHVLSDIPLKSRLLFTLAEKTSVHIVHESVKKLIIDTGVRGINMVESSIWTSNYAFS